MSERSPSPTRLLLAVLAIAGIFILAVPTTAQTLYGSVVGLAKDAQGAVLPGATVTLVNSGTGLKRDTMRRADTTSSTCWLERMTYGSRCRDFVNRSAPACRCPSARSVEST